MYKVGHVHILLK